MKAKIAGGTAPYSIRIVQKGGTPPGNELVPLKQLPGADVDELISIPHDTPVGKWTVTITVKDSKDTTTLRDQDVTVQQP